MSHLHSERLAALVDESPSTSELAHLAHCDVCARERVSYHRLAELAASQSARTAAPLTRWERLAPVLVADRVIHTEASLPLARHSVRRSWLQAAAAILLVAGGMVAGRYTAGASVRPTKQVSAVSGLHSGAAVDSTTHFASVDEARAAQKHSRVVYQSATAFLAQRDTSKPALDTPAAMRTRLAALDRTRKVMGDALQDSPYDPVINGYYISTSGQREATLQELNTVMPVSMRITSY